MQENEETSRNRRGSPTTRAVKSLKKAVAGVLCATMVFTGMPTITALADEGDTAEPEIIGVSTEAELNAAIARANTEGGSYIISLEEDITLANESDELTVTNEEAVVTILGNGYTIDDEADSAGHVLGANGGTLNLGVESGSNAFLEETWSNALTITSDKEDHATALIYVTGGTVNMYDGVKLENNHVSDKNVYGGAVHIEGGIFNMYGGEIDGCSARYGGAIGATGGTLNIYGGEIDKNDAVGGSSRGSAIYVSGSGTKAYISNITIEGNEVDEDEEEETSEAATEQLYGTLCFYSSCTAVLDKVTIQNNVARDGGGIYINGSNVTVKNSTIADNQAVHSNNTNGAGGGIYATGSSAVLTVDNCVITGNSCTGSGGGILTNNLSYVTIKESTISGNEAGATGGGIRVRNSSYVGSDNFTISGCTIDGNRTTDYLDEGDSTFVGGGGIFTSYVYGTIEDCTITNNYSERGGGICTYIGGRVDVKNSTISGNEAVRGGGMYTHTNATLNTTEISGNKANVGGGWLIETQVDYDTSTDSGINPTIEITNSKIINNTAVYSADIENVDGVDDSGIGGGIHLVSGNVTATDENVIANNTAEIAAADVYVGPYHSSTANSGRLHEYEPTLSLIDAAKMNQVYEADEEEQTIDGWYVDESNDRYYEPNAEGEKYLYEGYAEIDNADGASPVYLVASYSWKEYNVSFATDVNGSLEEIEGNSNFTFTVREGYTVETAPNAIAGEGYVFDHWLGSDGNSYTTDDILAKKILGDMVFTAIYREATSEPEEVAYGVLKVVKDVENAPEENLSYLFTLELVVESDSDALAASDDSDDDETGVIAYSIKDAYNETKESGVIYLDDIVDDVESPSNATRVELAEFELEDGEFSIYYRIPDGMTFIVTEVIESSNDAVRFETTAAMDGRTAGGHVENGYAVTGVMDASRTSEDPITIVFTNSYPSLKVEKIADIEDDYIAKAGDEIKYTITVTNDGKITLHDVTVEDPLTDDSWTVKTLRPGVSRKFTATYTVTEDDIANGEIVNTAIATGYDGDGNEVTSDPDDDDSTATVPTEESEDESGQEPGPDREFYDPDEEIVLDEDDPDSWIKEEVVSESTAIEFEITTRLPSLTAEDLAELADGDFTMVFHINLDEQLKREPEESDLHITIGSEAIDSKYYSIDINPAKGSWGISTLSVSPSSDGCSFHVTVDLAALYDDGLITADDFAGETELTVFFYADLEGAEPDRTYASTVWYDMYDDDVIIFTSGKDTVYVSIATDETPDETPDETQNEEPDETPDKKPETDEFVPTKTVDKGEGVEVNYGDRLTYTITYKNTTDKPATIVITDTLDKGLTFVSATDGGEYASSNRTVTWTLKNVEPGYEGSVSLTASVNSTGRSNGSISNTASVKVGDGEAVEVSSAVTNPVKKSTGGGGSGNSGSSRSSSSSSSGSVRNVNNGKTGHWILEGGYLTLPDGSHPSNEYLNVDGEIWAFYTYGYAVDRDRTEYYTDEAIAAAGYIPEVTGTWETIGWWFEYDDGTYPHDEWAYLEYNGRTDWYHFDVDGWMDDGWFTENGNTYYLHTVYDGTRGHMYTGWHEIDGYWYYFSEKDDSTLGALLKDTTTPDGYKVDAEGRWIE